MGENLFKLEYRKARTSLRHDARGSHDDIAEGTAQRQALLKSGIRSNRKFRDEPRPGPAARAQFMMRIPTRSTSTLLARIVQEGL